jgi:hypothetical protein
VLKRYIEMNGTPDWYVRYTQSVLNEMTYLLALVLVLGLAAMSRRFFSPPCPRCRSREWDRKLCAPLLFCRKCATRMDAQGRAYN